MSDPLCRAPPVGRDASAVVVRTPRKGRPGRPGDPGDPGDPDGSGRHARGTGWVAGACAASAVVAGAWSWWTAGTRPFGAVAYSAIGVPSAVLLVVVVTTGARADGRRAASASFAAQAAKVPVGVRVAWVAWLVAALGCEAAALALGGRSTTFATLSTAVDHLLRTRLSRGGLVALWLATGAGGVARLARAARGQLR